MKKCFLFLFSCLIALNAQTQYKRCLDDGIVRWSFLSYAYVADAGLTSAELAACGDTLINDHVYKKLYGLTDGLYSLIDVSEDNDAWKNFQPDLSRWYLLNTYIRESEDASKMYLYDAVREREYLISDMDLQEGDTLAGYTMDRYTYWTRDYVVDSVYIKEGLKHIYLINGAYPSITFIESVGPMAWPLVYLSGSNAGCLNCFQNQSVFYKDNEPDIGGLVYPCAYHSPPYGIKDIVTSDFTVVVEREQIKILFPGNTSVRVSLYDLSGRLWHSRQLSSNECMIETATFPKGMYLFKVFHIDKNKVSINKIII